jgi:predicted ribosome quality control (RQC) complex YloA/Tae2 family protein
MDVAPTEVSELKSQIGKLNDKFDDMSETLNEIKQALARQEGNNLPRRIHSVEEDVKAIRLHNAEHAWVPEQIRTNKEDIKKLSKFQYMIAGAITVINLIIAVAGKFLLDKIFG